MEKSKCCGADKNAGHNLKTGLFEDYCSKCEKPFEPEEPIIVPNPQEECKCVDILNRTIWDTSECKLHSKNPVKTEEVEDWSVEEKIFDDFSKLTSTTYGGLESKQLQFIRNLLSSNTERVARQTREDVKKDVENLVPYFFEDRLGQFIYKEDVINIINNLK